MKEREDKKLLGKYFQINGNDPKVMSHLNDPKVMSHLKVGHLAGRTFKVEAIVLTSLGPAFRFYDGENDHQILAKFTSPSAIPQTMIGPTA